MRQIRLQGTRLLLVLISVFCMATAHAQQGQSGVFNYLKDGDFNMFLNSEVDSIVYSNIGLDGIEYDNAVVQEVWTPDSVYRIPIENIDSISFHAPQPRYAEDVFPIMDDLLPYLVAVDDLTLTFSSDTPTDRLPLVGQVVVADTWEEPLDDGFAGRMVSQRQTSDGIVIECEEVSLDDVFESLVFVSRCATSEDAPSKKMIPRKTWWNRDIEIPETEDFIPLIPFKIGKEDGSPFTFEYFPDITIKYQFHVVKGEPARCKILLSFNHDFEMAGSHTIELDKDKGSHEWLGKKIRIPIPSVTLDAILKPYIQFGAFLDCKAKAEFDYSLKYTLTHFFEVDYDESRGDDAMQFTSDFVANVDNEKTNLELKMEGSLATGLAVVLGMNLLHRRLFNAEGHFHLGPMFTGTIDLNTNNIAEQATPYRLLKDTKISLDAYLSASATFTVLGHVQLAKRGTWKGATWKKDNERLLDEGFEWTKHIFDWYLLPDFDKPFVRRSTAQSAFCTLYPKRELIWPVDLGVKFTEYSSNNTGAVIEKDYGSYHSEKTLQEEYQSNLGYFDVIDGLKENTIYAVVPTVTLLGVKMNAEPRTDYGNSLDIFAVPNQLALLRGKTADIDIIGGSGEYEVEDINGDIARSVKLTTLKSQKKAVLTIYGADVGDAVFTVRDKRDRTRIVDIHVNVSIESEWGNLDDVPGSDL